VNGQAQAIGNWLANLSQRVAYWGHRARVPSAERAIWVGCS
jgi:hypothetical protein